MEFVPHTYWSEAARTKEIVTGAEAGLDSHPSPGLPVVRDVV